MKIKIFNKELTIFPEWNKEAFKKYMSDNWYMVIVLALDVLILVFTSPSNNRAWWPLFGVFVAAMILQAILYHYTLKLKKASEELTLLQNKTSRSVTFK